MRLSISIAAASAFLFASTSAFVPAVPSRSASAAVLGMSSVAEPEASTSSDAAATAADSADSADSSGDVNVAAGDRQKMYGNEIDLPETYVMCGRCKTAYALQADDLGTKGKGR